ncbi:Uma2 family endonuclease [Gloeobacter morelensis]|uniref:Uma2 family endonuclease n=1 Tax=Gloeobacter morelensis TaxID=2907343 RepID=UPI00211AEF31|nr:Uma2 family endonuclease [Gloeobacter morelensis]
MDDYHRMLQSGILTADERVELLGGQVFEVSPQEPPHAATTRRSSRYLDRLLEGRADVRTQLPITLRPDSEPEPDIAVVRCDPGEYADRHPAAADVLLLIEIADATLSKDRNQKALIYARAGIGDYWILETNKRRAIIFRDPGSEGYASEINLSTADSLSPVAFPDLVVPLSALFLP